MSSSLPLVPLLLHNFLCMPLLRCFSPTGVGASPPLNSPKVRNWSYSVLYTQDLVHCLVRKRCLINV